MLRQSASRVTSSVTKRSSAVQIQKCYYTRQATAPSDSFEPPSNVNDLIVSILQANPSFRDAKTYLGTFATQSPTYHQVNHSSATPTIHNVSQTVQPITQQRLPSNAVLETILNPMQRRTALVKIQGPFTDRQLESICRGLVYLEKLGLVCVLVVTRDDWYPGTPADDCNRAREDLMKVVLELERQGARSRPIMEPVVRLGQKPTSSDDAAGASSESGFNAHVVQSDLMSIRAALKAGEIPVLAPFAFDSFARMILIHANDAIAALTQGMVAAGKYSPKKAPSLDDVPPQSTSSDPEPSSSSSEAQTSVSRREEPDDGVDLTPLRLMIINREGGIPSYARTGLPHLLINLSSEYSYITNTFQDEWSHSHPTSLSNLQLSSTCLAMMPPTSSAIIVSHRSPRSLIANLITNKPAQSISLPHHLLVSGPKKLTPHTPTLIRKGLPMRVIQKSRMQDIDKDKLTALLEKSFGRVLDAEPFYKRLEQDLDYVIIAGDYAGAAIVTAEPIPSSNGTQKYLTYLDKFAVHPKHQGDGTVDFLWVALHDESFGLGLEHAVNPNEGGQMGVGKGKDLIWRSRSDNPANKWYFERSTGHLALDSLQPLEGDASHSSAPKQSWTMFWCDAEDRLKSHEDELVERGRDMAQLRAGKKGRGVDGLSFVEIDEFGRLQEWAEVVGKIPGSWFPKGTTRSHDGQVVLLKEQ